MKILADKKTIDIRRTICSVCPQKRTTKLIGETCGRFLRPNKTKRIKTCGCKLEIKYKLNAWHCPQNKW